MGDEEVAYYSSVMQFEAVCAALSASDRQYSCEVALLRTLNDIRTDVMAHMSLTAELTDKYRGRRKSAIAIRDGVFYLHSCIHSIFSCEVSVCGD